MRKFVFNLEPLLKVRQTKKDKLEREMAKTKQRLEQEKKLLKQMEYEKECLAAHIKAISLTGTKAGELREHSLYFQSILQNISIQEEKCNQVKQEYETLKAALVELLKHIETLEKLKEKQYKEYLYDVAKNEEKMVEELVNFKLTTRGEYANG